MCSFYPFIATFNSVNCLEKKPHYFKAAVSNFSFLSSLHFLVGHLYEFDQTQIWNYDKSQTLSHLFPQTKENEKKRKLLHFPTLSLTFPDILPDTHTHPHSHHTQKNHIKLPLSDFVFYF